MKRNPECTARIFSKIQGWERANERSGQLTLCVFENWMLLLDLALYGVKQGGWCVGRETDCCSYFLLYLHFGSRLTSILDTSDQFIISFLLIRNIVWDHDNQTRAI